MSSTANYLQFDRNGIIGPILTLLLDPNITELNATSEIVEANCYARKITLVKRKEFCKTMEECFQKTLEERLDAMMNTDFIKGIHTFNSVSRQPKSALHDKIRMFIVPRILLVASKFIPKKDCNSIPKESNFPAKIADFITCLYENCEPLNPTQEDACVFYETSAMYKEFGKNIENLIEKIGTYFSHRILNENDLNAILDGISKKEDYISNASNKEIVKQVVDEFELAVLLLPAESAQKVTAIAFRTLDNEFRSSYFPIQLSLGGLSLEQKV